MTLTGTYSRSLDEKHRLAVPKRLREKFSAKELTSLHVAPGTDLSLALYSPAAFDNLAERLSEKSPNRKERQNYIRLFYSQAEEVELDSQGRIRIPERLVDFARLEHDVMLLGVQDHAEIWNPALWDEFVARNGPEFDELATRAFE